MLQMNLLQFFIQKHGFFEKSYIYHQLKDCGLSKHTIYQALDRFDEEGTIERKDIDQNMVAGMFDRLKAKIHSANENGLSSLL